MELKNNVKSLHLQCKGLYVQNIFNFIFLPRPLLLSRQFETAMYFFFCDHNNLIQFLFAAGFITKGKPDAIL